MMNKPITIFLLYFLLFAAFSSCKRKTAEKEYTDTYTSGSLPVVVDESFAPIVNEELYIFKNDNPKANPQVTYRSENDAIRMLMNDSVRFAFLSRELTPAEVNVLAQRSLPVVSREFAKDAVVVIVNQSSADTSTSVDAIKKMLKGQTNTNRSIVFDNANSSLVRYLKNFAGVTDLKAKNIYALKSNKEAINYVSQHPEAIGITSFSWIDDPDKDYADAVKQVRVLSVKDEHSKTAPNQYFRPSQTTLYLKQYPLERSLYVVNCTGRKGLGAGLELFVEGDKGQRIILRSGLLPTLIPERNIIIHSNNKF
jgi:phosphate transport system substrate-binding protein